MIVPNETVVTSVVVNRSTGDLTRARRWPRSGCRPTPTSSARARRSARLEPSQVEVAEITPDGIRIEVHGPRRPGGTRAAGEEAALRERAQRALREAGVLADDRDARRPVRR